MSDKFEQKIFHMAEQEQMIVPEGLEAKIDAMLRQGSGRNLGRAKKKTLNFRRALVLAAALTMVFSITAAAAAGALRQRMEAMNREKLEEYFAQIYTSKVSADNYSRPVMDSERERMAKLRLSYEEQGIFPEKELTMLDEPADYKGKNIAFLKSTSTFFLPEREMNDEELLQIIDFQTKRDYSLQKMNEMIASGEAEFPEEAKPSGPDEVTDLSVLGSNAVLEPDKELTILYTGDLPISVIATGKDCIFLAGRNVIHRMEIGSSDSALFFDGFDKDTGVTALCQDGEGNVYAGLNSRQPDGSWDMDLWVLDGEGNFLKEIDLSPYKKAASAIMGGERSYGYIRGIMADNDYLYIRGYGFKDADFLLILNKDGGLVSKMTAPNHEGDFRSAMCIGKDGKPYTVVRDKDGRLGIAEINPKEGTLGRTYPAIVPEDTISLDLIAPGYDADFVLWGYSGSFSFNLNENAARQITPVYELPCSTEGTLYLALQDGRIVFANCTEYRSYTTEDGTKRHERIPEKTCFYYLPAIRK
ncbi:MAG: hypothetical protein NC400_13720 [Clostridium sp.]|nr:hypothetical protein [Clostridium sp.]